jgi:catecholate siderophore receptor
MSSATEHNQFEKFRGHKTMSGNLRRGLIASIGALGAAGTVASSHAAQNPAPVEEVTITGSYLFNSLSSPEYVLPLSDTPQSVTVVPDQLLAEQGRRTLRDSLRNISGISLQAGEGNPPGGGDAVSIRGFSGRDDLYVDGMRDPGNYFRDPFNAERIEVTKGPASAFAGRGNIGGTVNIVQRAPIMAEMLAGEASIGTHQFYRATADWNAVVSEEMGMAFRLNAMVHSADEPGRDFVNNKRWGVAPALSLGLASATQFTASYLHQAQDDVPDFGLPNARNPSLAGSGFEGRVAPVDPSNFYGYSTDYRNVTADIASARIDHAFTEMLSVRSQVRWARTHNDSIMSAPRFVGTVTTLGPSTLVVGNQKPRDQIDKLLANQTDVTLQIETGALAHTFVGGFEIARESSENRRRLDTNGPTTNLFDPVRQAAPPVPYNGTRARLDVDSMAFYVFDTIEIGAQWRIVAGLRYDDIESRVRGFDDSGTIPGFVTDLSATDTEWSGNGAIVFKPTEATSLYLAYGTAFEPSGRVEVVQLAGGNNNPPVTSANFFVDPELSDAWEVGFKWDALDGRLAFTSALFQIERTNARTPGVNPGDPPIVLDGAQRVRGFELGLIGDVAFWHFFGTYSYLDGEVTKSNRPFEVGQRLDNLPRHSGSLWVSYIFENELTLGGGIQHVGERTSHVRTGPTDNIVITTDAYTVLDAFAEYPLLENVDLRLNVYNLTNETYFQSFYSGQSIPSATRSAVLSLSATF